ncbi:Stromal membrane-associated protein 1 [Lemmus lemmus]
MGRVRPRPQRRQLPSLAPAPPARSARPARRPAADMATRSCREKAQKLNEQHQLILSKLRRLRGQRSPMGFLEYWCVYLHQMCWNS